MKIFLTALCLSWATLSYANLESANLVPLSDSELSKVEAQALFSFTYTDPKQADASMNQQNIGFYKLGLEANLELNANVNKLQLGCGGVNGLGGCDIDIDNLSLSGLSDTSDGRASSSAVFSNPFIEFAIKNPDSAALREIKGFRLSAEKVIGLLTMGLENSEKTNGINSLSGYMKIKDTTGLAYTAARNMSYQDTGKTIDGTVNACIGICIPLGFNSSDYNLQLQQTTAPIVINGQVISGSRMNNVMLNGVANIDQLNFSGDLKASINAALGLLNLQKNVTGSITGLRAALTVDQNLGFIHKIELNNPFSLSLQGQQIFWPGADAAAERGWWMAFDDEIDIGNVTPSKQIEITNDVLKQVVGPISGYLTANPVRCNLLNCLFGEDLAVGEVKLPNTIVNFPLKDLQLKNQSFAPNCYGNLKFC
ncbi:hypothetical protein [Acinetobacter sp. yr461]|uniref:hypothetical protein n=1 Tax=Acinetobacter sp. yr461 TaxID=1761742 RepID=UPI0008B55ADE|nr:hypothetical protein [Acinetobacter sp. yr461]SEO89654.1 hypothetical protein SAMN04487817_12717 [Acinetobacter sp. yr461]